MKIERQELCVQDLNEKNKDLADALRSSRRLFEDDDDDDDDQYAFEYISNVYDKKHDPGNFMGVCEYSPPIREYLDSEYTKVKKLRKTHVQKPTFTSIHRQVLQTKLKDKCSNEHMKEKSIHGGASFIPSGKEHATKNLIASNSQFHRQKHLLETAT